MSSTENKDNTATGVIIPAAGSGTRMGSDVPKQFLALAGEPILTRTVRAFLEHAAIRQVVVVVPAAQAQETRDILRRDLTADQFRRLTFTVGGATRQDSVRAGLQVLAPTLEVILVHDGARPLVSASLIDRCIRGAREHGAVIAAVAVKDTLKQVGPAGRIEQTIDRSRLWQAQTPQAAQRKLLVYAHARAAKEGFIGTDEASLLEHADIPVHVVEGEEQNIKITRPGDMPLAAGLLKENSTMKIGHGFDAHRLVADRRLILGGVSVPYELGLLGHSDADVLTHALIDALLGAMGKGDIGALFPDTDSTYRDISSIRLLEQVMALAMEEGLRLVNADTTILCQRPKLAPHLEAMRDSLATACRVAPTAINIKATTTEQMGYTGRGEGIAAHAVVLMQD